MAREQLPNSLTLWLCASFHCRVRQVYPLNIVVSALLWMNRGRIVAKPEVSRILGCQEQTQILHCVQDDSALESRNACRFGIADGWWPPRKYRGFWDAKSKRRSFTAFRMIALWNAAQDDSASEVWWQRQHNLLVRHRFDLFWKSATPALFPCPHPTFY